MYGHAKLARLLVQAGADKTIGDANGLTPLHLASAHAHCAIARMLLAAGADVRASEDTGVVALHLAAVLGHKDVARVLVEARADKNVRQNDGLTPLFLGSPVVPSILLFGSGFPCKINQRKKGALIVIMVLGLPRFLASFHGCLEVARFLLHSGANPDVPQNDGSTALLVAAHHGHAAIVGSLLEAAAATDVQQKDICTPKRTPKP